MHKAAVYIGIEEVGHGQDSAVSKRCQAARHAPLPPTHCLALVLYLTAVIQQVHEQREVPGHQNRQDQRRMGNPMRKGFTLLAISLLPITNLSLHVCICDTFLFVLLSICV